MARWFLNPRSFELRDGREDMQLQLACWCRRVDALAQTHERDAQRLHLIDQRDQVPQVSPEPIQTPDDDGIEPPPLRISHHRVERGSPLPRTADAVIDMLDGVPSACSGKSSQLHELIVGVLVERGDTSI